MGCGGLCNCGRFGWRHRPALPFSRGWGLHGKPTSMVGSTAITLPANATCWAAQTTNTTLRYLKGDIGRELTERASSFGVGKENISLGVSCFSSLVVPFTAPSRTRAAGCFVVAGGVLINNRSSLSSLQ